MKYLSVLLIFTVAIVTSGCGEGAGSSGDTDIQLGAANTGTANSGTSTATDSGTNSSVTDANNASTENAASGAVQPASAGEVPTINFIGTTFQRQLMVGDIIYLDGSSSTIHRLRQIRRLWLTLIKRGSLS